MGTVAPMQHTSHRDAGAENIPHHGMHQSPKMALRVRRRHTGRVSRLDSSSQARNRPAHRSPHGLPGSSQDRRCIGSNTEKATDWHVPSLYGRLALLGLRGVSIGCERLAQPFNIMKVVRMHIAHRLFDASSASRALRSSSGQDDQAHPAGGFRVHVSPAVILQQEAHP